MSIFRFRFLVDSSASYAPHCEWQCVQKDGEIHKDSAITDVVKIVLDVFMDRERTICAELPDAGDPRNDLETLHLGRRILFNHEWHLWPRADQRHIPSKNIQKLRELIKAGAPKDPPDWGDPRIPAIDRRTRVSRRIKLHRAELVD